MKVKELITLLKEQDPEAKVLIYCFEDFKTFQKITTKVEATTEINGLYCKGYTFEEYNTDYPNSNYIVLRD